MLSRDFLVAARDRVEGEIYRRSLKEFMRAAWANQWPAKPLIWGWHLDAICEHLEAVSRGDIRKLVINMPPRCCKSTLVSVMWPAWEWISKPHLGWFFASYDAGLARRDNLACRRIIESGWYQSRWGDRIRLADDENRQVRYLTTAGGYRLGTSVAGKSTGEGGERIVVDDPHNAARVLSEADRKAVIDWWCNAMSSRDNDPLAMSRVIVMQRLHLEDLTGYVLANEDYEHLCLPMRYDSRRHCSTSLGWEDPRTEDGELLWPERFPEAADAALRKGMRSKFIAAAQLEQDPQPLGGSIVQQDWIRCWQDLPPGLDDWVQSWDMAFKGKSDSADGNPAYVVGQVWARRSETYYLIDQVRGQWDIVETIRQLRHLSRKWPQATKKMIEDKASGPAVMQLLRGKVAGLVARNPDRDKKSRLHAVAPFFEGGCVYIPHPEMQPWVDDWVYEITTAPQCHYWDQIDSMTQALLEYQDEPGFVLARG